MTRTRKCRLSLSLLVVLSMGEENKQQRVYGKEKYPAFRWAGKTLEECLPPPPTHHRAISENIQNSTPVPSFSLPSFFFFFEHHKLDVVNISSLCSGNTSPTRPPPPYSILALLVLSLSLFLERRKRKGKITSADCLYIFIRRLIVPSFFFSPCLILVGQSNRDGVLESIEGQNYAQSEPYL